MKKTVWSAAVLALMCCAAACSSSNIKRTSSGVEAGSVSVAKATVLEIDYKNRSAVLKDADGALQFVNVGPDAKNFDKVRVGDTVVAEVIESVEVVVGDAAGEPGVKVSETAQRYADRPGAEKVTVTEASARVEKIDYENRIITLQGSNGRIVTTQAGPEVKRLEMVRPGDMITMRTTKQTIIRVETP